MYFPWLNDAIRLRVHLYLTQIILWTHIFHYIMNYYWSESESKSDIAWNALHWYCAVYLHWSESDFTWKLGCNPFWSDVASNVLLSFSLHYKCSIRVELYWSERESKSDIAWNGYIGLLVVCLYWVAITSGKDQRNFHFRFRSNIIRP